MKVTPEVRDELAYTVEKEYERRLSEDPVSMFPWHERQKWVLYGLEDNPLIADRAIRYILAAGGNQGGKSALGKMVLAQFVRRQHALNRQLRKLDPLTRRLREKKPEEALTIWVVPPTGEKIMSDWIEPGDGMGIRYWLGDLFVHESRGKVHVIYSRPPGVGKREAKEMVARGTRQSMAKLDRIILKSHDQDKLTFEASTIDLCIVDEELLDESKWNSIKMRIGALNGCIMMCYTPLHGLTWTYETYWKRYVREGEAVEVADRCWIGRYADSVIVMAQFGCGDNPIMRSYAEEIAHDPAMSKAEKAARLYGEYGFVEGSLVPDLAGIDIETPSDDHEVYVVDQLPERVDSYYTIADPNKSWGCLFGVADEKGNLFIIAEHLEEEWPDRRHAAAIQGIERQYYHPKVFVVREADPGSAGGQSIVNLNDLGLLFNALDKPRGSVSLSIKKLRSYAWKDPQHRHPFTGRPGAPRVYFYRPGLLISKGSHRFCRIAEQLSQARQSDTPGAAPDTPHKDAKNKLDLFDCLRYMVLRHARPQNQIVDTTFKRDQPNILTMSSVPDGRPKRYAGFKSGFFSPDWGLD